jgi:hypothetical protein
MGRALFGSAGHAHWNRQALEHALRFGKPLRRMPRATGAPGLADRPRFDHSGMRQVAQQHRRSQPDEQSPADERLEVGSVEVDVEAVPFVVGQLDRKPTVLALTADPLLNVNSPSRSAARL